jgi:hypothetical protein
LPIITSLGNKYTLDSLKQSQYLSNLQTAESQNLDYSRELQKRMILNEELDRQQLKERLKEKKLKKKVKLQQKEEEKRGTGVQLEMEDSEDL